MNLKQQLSIATFNLHNLNEPGPGLQTDRDGLGQHDRERMIARTARELTVQQADVFGFRELGHGRSLARALEAAESGGGEYDLPVPPGTDGRHIVCAATGRQGPLAGRPDRISGRPTKLGLEPGGGDLRKAVDRSRDRRLLAAGRALCDPASRAGQPDPGRRPSFQVGGPDPGVCRAPLRSRSRDLREGLWLGVVTIRRMAGAAALRFLLTAQTLHEHRDPRDVDDTRVFQDRRESLGHILVGERFYDRRSKRLRLFERLLSIHNDLLSFDTLEAGGTRDHGVIGAAAFGYKPIRTPL